MEILLNSKVLLTMQTLKAFLSLLLLLTIWSDDLLAQEQRHQGRPLWHMFDTRDTGAMSATRDATLDGRGILYGANDAGLVSFDGITWRVHSAGTEKIPLRQIVALENGAWLAASDNTLGTFTPNTIGDLEWKSLPRYDSTDSQSHSKILALIPHNQITYVITDSSVLVLNADLSTSEIYDGAPTGFGFVTDGSFVFSVENGLVQYSNGNSKELVAPPNWSALKPVSYIEGHNENSIILTQRSGLFRADLNENGLSLVPLWDVLPSSLEAPVATAGTRNIDGSFIIGTSDGTLIQFDSDGNQLSHISRANGFKTGEIQSIVSDINENLFVFFYGGMAWFDLNDHSRVWDVRNGLPEAANTILVDGASTYAGTNGGLYRSVAGGRMRQVLSAGPAAVKILTRFERSSMKGHSSILLGREDGLFELFNGELTEISNAAATALFISRTQPTRMAVGIGNRIALFKFDSGEWLDIGALGKVNVAPVSDFIEADDGTLLVVLSDGTVKMFAADNWLSDKKLAEAKPTFTQVFPYKSSMTIRPMFTIFRNEVHLFGAGLPHYWQQKLGKFTLDTGLATEIARMQRTPTWFSSAHDNTGLWMQTDHGAFLYTSAAQELIELPRTTQGTFDHSSTYVDAKLRRIAFGTPEGIVSIPSAKPPNENEHMLPLLSIRSISVDGDEVYRGEGLIGPVPVRPSASLIKIALSTTNWFGPCNQPDVIAEVTDINTDKIGLHTIDKNCHLTLRKETLSEGHSKIKIRMVNSHAPQTQFSFVDIHMPRPWLNGGATPLLLAIVVSALAVFGKVSARRSFSEPVRRYLALLSGLYLITAVALIANLLPAPIHLSAWSYWLLGPAGIALLLPAFTEMILRLSEHKRQIR